MLVCTETPRIDRPAIRPFTRSPVTPFNAEQPALESMMEDERENQLSPEISSTALAEPSPPKASWSNLAFLALQIPQGQPQMPLWLKIAFLCLRLNKAVRSVPSNSVIKWNVRLRL